MPDTLGQRIKILSEIKDPFGRVPNIIIDLYGPAMGQAGWLYTLLTRFKNNDSSETYVGIKTLAETGGVTENTIRSWSDHLSVLGVIRIIKDETYKQEKRRAMPHTYVLLLPALPPPPELVALHWPPQWTPPDRALKAIQNIGNYLTLDSRPQEATEDGGVGSKFEATPSLSTPSPGGVGEKSAPSRVKIGGERVQELHPNKTLLTSLSEQAKETTTTPVVQAFLNLVLETFRQKDPNISFEEMGTFYQKCLNLKGDDEEKAQDYLREKIKVVFQLKKTNDPRAVLWKAIQGDWKPRPDTPKGPPPEERFAGIERIKAENKRIDEENEKLRRTRQTFSIEQIIQHFQEFPAFLELDRRLRMLGTTFSENPNLEKALETIKQKEKGG